MTKIYIAAPYAVRDVLAPYADRLAMQGHTITSSWLLAEHEIGPGTLETAPDLSNKYADDHSRKDIQEVLESELLILVTWKTALRIADRDLGGNSGGRHVETGAALAKGIGVIVWGEPENIFHRSSACFIAPDWLTVLDTVFSNQNRGGL